MPSSREALLAALAAVAFGAASGATPADAKTDPAAVCNRIAVASDPAEVRAHLGDVDCGAPAVARLMELQGFVQVAQASGDPNQLCLYKPDDPRYRLDPRCPPLGLGPVTSSSSSGSSSGPPTAPPDSGYPG
jgi:hypothetical protein